MPINIKFSNNTTDTYKDTFNRLRVSEPFIIFDSNFICSEPNIYNKGQKFHSEQVNNNASILAIDNSIKLTVTDNNDKAILQSKAYIPSQQGKSKISYIAAVLTDDVNAVGVTSRVGAFDDLNDKSTGKMIAGGHFFQWKDGILSVCERNTINGVQVDNIINQGSWNIDNLDGTGNSGMHVGDITDIKIFIIEMIWLGSGSVRLGFIIDGIIYYCHEFMHYNNNISYIPSPTVPIRIDLEASQLTNTSSTLFAYSTMVEGGELNIIGIKSSISFENRQINNTTYQPICMFRLKADANRIISFVNTINLISTDDKSYSWRLYTYSQYDQVITYTSMPLSAIEYNTTDTPMLLGGYINESGVSPGYTYVSLNPIKLFNGFIGSQINGDSISMCIAVKCISGATSSITGTIGIRELT